MAKSPRPKRSAPKKSKGASAPKSPRASKGASKAPRARATKAAPAPKVSGGYPVICSECYAEFDFNPATSASQVTCPVCMHVGQVAAREDQARFQIAKGREKSRMLAGLVPGVLFVVIGLVWMFLLNSKGSAEELGAGLNYGLLGVTVILFIISLFGAVKYEASRYEVYF